ncbi:MAG: GAF domain-containing protein [Acidobacteria bacterium]|nr:GAF domain-containing protein [Acidobacteriota bacterium]MCB9398519.1 GAF domain-containing protein [Acidobacteriota bacterium]
MLDLHISNPNLRERLSRVLPATAFNLFPFNGWETLNGRAAIVWLTDEDPKAPSPGNSLVVVANRQRPDCDLWQPDQATDAELVRTLHTAMALLTHRQAVQDLQASLAHEKEQMIQLTNIGIALSAERDLNKLLTLILSEGRDFANCDAASLFLIDRSEERPRLLFKLTQNDSISFPFQEQSFPLDKHSIAGFVALSGEELCVEDVYLPQADAPWRFNSSFDSEMGYRTRSMLVIPMKNHHNEVIGVLQFINRKKDPSVQLIDEATTLRETLPFDSEIRTLLQALASQAAVAIDNSLLLASIQNLFEGFVSASVTAIEQRDPTTSGHSFRVAELTTLLAQAAPRSGLRRFEALCLNEAELKELRYASLLHDFGKVGVREHVLVKAEKLPKGSMDAIWYRFELLKEQMRREATERILHAVIHQGPEAYEAMRQTQMETLAQQITELEQYFLEIIEANKPSILPSGRFSHLENIRRKQPFQVGNRQLQLLSEDEFLTLSVRKGSLTPEERKEIESHVVHTFNFLTRIPWTNNLKNIPALAVAHHEKLDGTGYPHGLRAPEIPIGAKMMTISDIYDALTASDRPYKTAMPAERACSILEDEAKAKLLDGDLVQVFIEAKCYQQVDPNFGKSFQAVAAPYQRSVCDHEELN